MCVHVHEFACVRAEVCLGVDYAQRWWDWGKVTVVFLRDWDLSSLGALGLLRTSDTSVNFCMAFNSHWATSSGGRSVPIFYLSKSIKSHSKKTPLKAMHSKS